MKTEQGAQPMMYFKKLQARRLLSIRQNSPSHPQLPSVKVRLEKAHGGRMSSIWAFCLELGWKNHQTSCRYVKSALKGRDPMVVFPMYREISYVNKGNAAFWQINSLNIKKCINLILSVAMLTDSAILTKEMLKPVYFTDGSIQNPLQPSMLSVKLTLY